MKKTFLTKYKSLKKSEFINVSLRNSVQVILRFMVGVFNIKIISIWLGTSGLALTGQFTNFLQIAGTIAGIGTNQGMTKLVSQYSNSERRKILIIGNGIFLTLILSIITSVLLYLFSEQFALYILRDIKFQVYFKTSGIVVFSLSLNNMILSVLNGLKQYRTFIRLNILMIISSFVFTVPCTYFWKLEGAIFAQYLSGIAHTIFAIILTKKTLIKAMRSFTFSIMINKRLMGFGLMLIIASVIPPIISILIRNLIISEHGITMAGWWEGTTRVSRTFFGLCLSSLGLYYLPQISKQQSGSQLNNVVWSTIKQAMPFIAAGIFIIFLSKNLIIKILFTEDFKGMNRLFLYQNIGDFFRIFNWFFAITFIIKEKIKIYIISEVIMAITYTSLVYTIIPRLSINYSTLPYMINTIIYFLLSQYIYKKHILPS